MPDSATDDPASGADSELWDLFEHAPCGYILVEPGGRVSKANATLARWVGVATEDLRGRRITDILTTGSAVLYETSVAPLLRLKGRLEEVALDLATADGGRLPILLSASERRNAGGELIGVRVIAMGATERKGYERQLRDREALAVQMLADEQAIAGLREQFIAVLGHDLRNPLAAVTSGVRLLQRDPSREKAELIAGMMHASVLRMSGMIENVLDFARGRLGGGISLQRAPADLEASIRQVTAELRAANPGRSLDEAYHLPPLVDCDAPRLSQLVSNLVGNAIAHGDPATFVRVEAFATHTELGIEVSNGGDPIPDDQMKALFEPFSHEAGSTPRKGLGLGLFIASQIARAHGGVLTATSSVTETRFSFRMPLATA